jgi:quercetin dioxygenase-like cupin family protein
MDVHVVNQHELPAGELIGADHGGAGVCVIFVDAPPGGRPSLHKHPYEELFIVLKGEVTFLAGDDEVAHAGATS